MSRRRKGRDVHGILLLDKPAGYSSNQAVQKVRWLFDARKAGHTGSLDPFATGMLPICLGEASKTAGFMLDASKAYEAEARVGTATTTGDLEGEPAGAAPVPALDAAAVREVMVGFLGEIEQIPPMHSALKRDGTPLYRLARAGIEVPREARTVTVHALELLHWDPPSLVLRVHCSKGTYVRTLAEDIAGAMGSCAHLVALRRLWVEPFESSRMVTLEALETHKERGSLDECLLPPDAGLASWPLVRLDAAEAARFLHGNPVPDEATPGGLVRVYGPRDGLLGLGERTPDRMLRPRRVFLLQHANDE